MTESVFLAFLLALLPSGKLLFSMDRTTWERGNAPLNLLVLGVVLHGYTVPLVWTALDHDDNSGTVRRIELVADREFIGGAWFRFLKRKGIKRAIRILKNAVVDKLRVNAWFADLKVAIATDFSVWDTCVLYRARWSVECTFASLKVRGADLEQTGITRPDRLERLFGLVILA